MPPSAPDLQRGQARSGFLRAPGFQPSAEHFRDPIAYFSNLRQPLETFGLCRAALPAGWTPALVDTQEGLGSFPLAQHALHLLQDPPSNRARKAEAFQQQYAVFLEAQGKTLKKPPVAGGKELDLSVLYRVVSKRGGFASVSEAKGWKQVASALQASHLPYARLQTSVFTKTLEVRFTGEVVPGTLRKFRGSK